MPSADLMAAVPSSVAWLFVGTTVLALGLVYSLLVRSRLSTRSILIILSSIVLWLVIQSGISSYGIYNKYPDVLPPYIFLLGMLPPIFCILILFAVPMTRSWIERLNAEALTLVHVIRMPVEVVILLLSLYHVLPHAMTFQGSNYDIIAGMTAPLVANWQRKKIKNMPRLLVVWNILSLLLLVNVVRMAILSAPSPLQTMAFDQPNIALQYFPYVWLPTFIVPLVLFSHIAALWNLLRRK